MGEAAVQAVQRFPAQPGTNSRQFDATGETFGQIESFLADGLRVGVMSTVNTNLTTYHYVAWPIKTGVTYGDWYTGNQTDNRNITGLGFQPEYMITTRAFAGYEPVQRMASMAGDASSRANQDTLLTNHIQSFLADGFQLGDHFGVNGIATPHHYIAFNDLNLGADLSLKMVLDDTLKNVADTVSVYLTLANVGPDDATGIQVTDLLPAGLTYVTHLATQGTYDFITGLWNVGTLLNTDMAGLVITAVVAPGTAGNMLTNIAAVTAVDQVDPNPSDNSATASVYIQGVDVRVSKSVDNAVPNEGEQITYDVRVTNNGPDDATGVEVMDPLPAGVTHIFSSTTHGLYTSGTGRWSIGALAFGDTATLSIDAGVDPG
ncbi:MAG: DUF11 domain-containing protein, partial [Candidatus Krumholzibacteria bacterium]|nr:DUF11 domain-containing protein [Candidatus Krumholzibacteria bacterium]